MLDKEGVEIIKERASCVSLKINVILPPFDFQLLAAPQYCQENVRWMILRFGYQHQQHLHILSDLLPNLFLNKN